MLEKQYSRIIRWVNRAQSMSADGNFSDAILDVECARAELEDARQELLLCHQEGCERKPLPKVLLATLGAIIAVLAWAVPLHRFELSEFISLPDSVRIEARSLGMTVTDSVQQNVQPEHSEVQAVAVVNVNQDRVTDASEPSQNVAKTVSVTLKSAGAKQNLRVVSQRTKTRLSAAEMIRLTEVGRRALQKDKSVTVLELN